MGILTVKSALQKFENLYAARERLEKNKKKICVLLVRYLKIRWRADGCARVKAIYKFFFLYFLGKEFFNKSFSWFILYPFNPKKT